MLAQKVKTQYRSKLPHIIPMGATFFVTFRLADAIPPEIVKALKFELDVELATIKAMETPNKKRLIAAAFQHSFEQFDQYLDDEEHGECLLRDPDLAGIVRKEILRFDQRYYKALAFCIMPNHVHLLLDFSIQLNNQVHFTQYQPLWWALKRIKGASARYINKTLDRSGRIWQKDSYDRYIRHIDHLTDTLNYIQQQPRKTKQSERWEESPFTYNYFFE